MIPENGFAWIISLWHNAGFAYLAERIIAFALNETGLVPRSRPVSTDLHAIRVLIVAN